MMVMSFLFIYYCKLNIFSLITVNIVGHGTKSVAELQEGDEVLFSLQENAARHTGIAIKEQILEK